MKVVGLALVAACVSSFASAGLVVSDAWTRPSAPGAKMASVYLTVKNTGNTADALVSVSADWAKSTMLHASATDKNGTTRMVHLPNGVSLGARTEVKLEPGGTHIMLMGLKLALKVDQTLPITLQFKQAKPLSVAVKVLSAPDSAKRSNESK